MMKTMIAAVAMSAWNPGCEGGAAVANVAPLSRRTTNGFAQWKSD
jgi:hypothetical protein